MFGLLFLFAVLRSKHGQKSSQTNRGSNTRCPDQHQTPRKVPHNVLIWGGVLIWVGWVGVVGVLIWVGVVGVRCHSSDKPGS